MIITLLEKLFGTKNDKILKAYHKRLMLVNALDATYQKMSDKELKQCFKEIQTYYKDNSKASLEDKLTEVFALVREASHRTLELRPYDVQIIGGMVLNDGKIAEMKTGEGKTLVATMPAILNTLVHKSVHIVTVNDYLANRDAQTMGDLYSFFDLTVGVIISTMDEEEKKEAYGADIVYGTNNEYAFSYLKDNMKYSLEEVAQKHHYFAIVDEVDSILIDEARTPLIISGPANSKMQYYAKADEVAQKLGKEEHFEVDEKNRTVLINEEGIAQAEKLFGIQNLYSLDNAGYSHQLDQALKANYLFEKDVHYIVKDNEVIIVDEFTGRLSVGRRFSEGLHQALEAKERVKIQEESQTLADISFQNYFRLYDKLSGMTGTAQTEATEFIQIYGLDVVSIPTNVPIQRDDKNDLVYKTKKEKFEAVIKTIKSINQKGQPILVGTTSIEQSEHLHKLLKKDKIAHTVLNAKNHAKEAEIIKNAGVKGAVTIATNMAGRGVDIKIDKEVEALGGLCILGTERHESRRIDNQLRGRSGRQGDKGISQFYMSLEDNLLRIFGSDRIKTIMDKLGIEEGEHIDSRMVTRAVENAQKKVETMNFEARKHLLEFDDVANKQRQVIYQFRRELLSKNVALQDKLKENCSFYVAQLLDRCGIVEGMLKNDFEVDGVQAILKEDLRVDMEMETKDVTTLKEEIAKKLWSFYSEKMSVFEDIEQRNYVESIVYLQVLDGLWREHLYQMDILKTGIGLRGYNQKDPLVEYKKESYNLFEDLIYRSKKESFQTLFIVEFQPQDAQFQQQQEDNQEFIYSHELAPGETPKKIRRNDPCPCGSGKKYKVCHGKSGPKKGVFAS